MNKLRDLDLYGSPIDDAGCQLLPKYFPHLDSLDLRKSKITDMALESIADLPELNLLILDRTAISNAGLAKLGRLSRLRHLSVTNTGVDQEGIDALKTAIPGLNVALRNLDAVPGNMNDMHRNPAWRCPNLRPSRTMPRRSPRARFAGWLGPREHRSRRTTRPRSKLSRRKGPCAADQARCSHLSRRASRDSTAFASR